MPAVKFDWTFNLGHILTALTLLAGGAFAWSTLKSEVAVVDNRTSDYLLIRDQTKANTTLIVSLQTLVQTAGNTNERVVEQLTKIREDISAIKATVDATRRATTP